MALYNSRVDFDVVEFLSFPDIHGEQTYVLSFELPTLPKQPSHVTDSSQLNLTDSISNGATPDKGTLGYALTIAQRKLKTQLPEGTTLNPVRVSFAPLGASAVTTARLVNRRNRRVTAASNIHQAANGFEQILTELRDEPHLYQVLIQNQDATSFTVSSRIALFGPRHQATTDTEISRLVNEGHSRTPSSGVANLDLSSNLVALREYLYAADGSKPAVPGYHDIKVDEQQTLLELFIGHLEYQDLLRGRIGASPIYSKLDYFPKFIVSERDLTQLIGLPSLAHDSPWDVVPGRDPPELELISPDEFSKPMAATARSQRANIAEAVDTRTVQDGSDEHLQAILDIIQILRERGWMAVKVEQENDSVPDIWALTPDGELVIVEVECQNGPAGLLTNIARAVHWNIDVLIVWAPTADDTAYANADRSIDTVDKPFRAIDDDRTRLYNLNDELTRTDEPTPLLPPNIPECEWWLTPEGELELVADGTVVASGPATDSIATFEYDLPAYRTDGDGYIIENADGNAVKECAELPEGWSKIYPPFVPTRLTYLPYPTFRYLEDMELKPYVPQGDWDREGHMNRYKGALREYFGAFTVKQEDEHILFDVIRPHARQWYRQLTDRKEPADGPFGTVTEHFEKAGNPDPDESGRNRRYQNRTWRYPRKLTSPDLPEFGECPALPEELAEEMTHDLPRDEHDIIASTDPLAATGSADESTPDDEQAADPDSETSTDETDTTTDESDADEDATDETATTAEDETTANETADTTETDATAESTDDDRD
ncbi:hypothetical protein [Halorientalis persicus]|uniref:hypothetical protein n=1 Tax=Halorientalis persicus TaxID=1367881 RepID=UPI000B823A73|nr:hypothetical protein [Halorientalis persicus]